MQRNSFLVLVLLAVMSFGFACSEDANDDNNHQVDGDVTEDEIESDSEATETSSEFRFVVIADTHVRLPDNPDDKHYDNQENIDNLKTIVEHINKNYSDADFVTVAGDLVGCLFSENPDDYLVGKTNPAETYKEYMEKLTMPYYSVLGNHDYQKSYDEILDEGVCTDDISAIESVWKKVLGLDPYYSVVHKGIRFIFLNANRGNMRTKICTGSKQEAFCTGSFDDEQLDWFENEMKKGDPAIITMHHPPFTDHDTNRLFSFVNTFYVVEEDNFYNVVKAYKEKIMAIFVGHGHLFERDTLYDTIQVYETSSVGDMNGQPDNIHVVDVNPNKPSIKVSIGKEGVEYFHSLTE